MSMFSIVSFHRCSRGVLNIYEALMSRWLHLQWIIACKTLILFNVGSKGFPGQDEAHREVPTKAGAAICTLSKTLKDVTPWATQQMKDGAAKITHLELKRVEWQSKFIQSNSKGSGYEECKITGLLFRRVRNEIDRVRAEVEKLGNEASKAAAFAANSARCLEEFITVFANAKGDDSNY
ncbi:unnamed protein product [Trypanosoma congolense IL3000]|uniref:WGS project CAEQ00000000 data, annotated contig 1504 n=1 Tax=Trypanosoma congolense (strain IL3000) TaxID=1068625 RepID=F9W6Q3_TRYCI|nr:unnamed protein product [Trypanosoma congolense IL3000]